MILTIVFMNFRSQYFNLACFVLGYTNPQLDSQTNTQVLGTNWSKTNRLFMYLIERTTNYFIKE